MIRAFSFITILIVVAASCSKPAQEKPTGKLNGLHKYYYPDGNLYLEINYQDSLPHGMFKQYFKSGKLFEETIYVRGVKHGLSKRYHDNGALSSETPYDNGRIHGVQKKYRRDGQLAFEAPYYYDNPCVGLKEYYLSGNPVKNYPYIVIKADDELLANDRYTVNFSLSNKNQNVEFFKGQLTDGKYIGKDLRVIYTSKGVGKLYYMLPPGGFVMERMNIIAKVKTDLNNYYITQTTYNLSAENR